MTTKAKKTTKRRKPKLSSNLLNNTILFGTVVGTLTGAQLLANQDVPAAPAPIIITQSDGTDLIIDIAPIPELVIPEPVTRSRSSR